MMEGDTISRQAAIDAVIDRMDIEKHGRNAKPEEIRWTLEKLPPAQPRRGKWKDGKCDQCSGSAPFWPLASTYYRSNFCPHCGADMREVRKDGTD